jgi:hypothetical protein
MAKKQEVCVHIGTGGVIEADNRGFADVREVRHRYSHPDCKVIVTAEKVGAAYGPHHPTVSSVVIAAVAASGFSAMRLVDCGAKPRKNGKSERNREADEKTFDMFQGCNNGD